MSSLTAIVCNYNHGHVIGQSLDAMLKQSRPPDEILIVDDGSQDDSVITIDAWVAKSPTIRFLRNERNLGWHASTAKALAVATGDYLYSGAADDYVLPGFFEVVCGLMDQYPAAGIGCAQVLTITPDGQPLGTNGYRRWTESRFVPAEVFLRQGLEAEPPTHSLSSATIYRRDRLLQIGGFRRELGPWSDTFAIRALGLQSGLCYVPQPGAAWTRAPFGMSQSNLRDPMRTLSIVRAAAALMRSAEFREVFPADHAAEWEAASVEAIVIHQLQPAIDGYQAVQQVSRDTGRQASAPMRCLLSILRKLMTAGYLASHHLERRIVRQRLLAAERNQQLTTERYEQM